MPSRIAIIGAAGQLGSDLVRALGSRGVALVRADIDIASPESVAAAFDRVQPDAVINAAAYNFVDPAETDPEPAFRGNAFGPLNLARACAKGEIPLLHVSTDYVFGADTSRTTPYRETDAVGPVSVYGVSKATGEQLVRMAATKHFIVRTCGLYGTPAPGSKGNFVQTIRRLASERDELRVVDDQRCTPSSTADVAAALIRLIDTDAWGTYHATNSGDCSWFDLASEIVRVLGLKTRVVPTTTAEFPRPARRPGYSVLDCSKLAGVIGAPPRPWREALAAYLGQAASAPVS
jgi:dTDP-4-dehydrorhamnose reductase